MLREMPLWLWDGSAAGGVALVVAVLSLFAAIYAHLVLTRMTRRNRYAAKQFDFEVDPWIAEARNSYAKHMLSGAWGKGKF